jgi:hypothetical protein
MGDTRIEMTGERFGRLTVVKCVGRQAERRLAWLCKCDCGSEKEVSGKNLRRGLTRSCGCLHRERAAQINASHGKTNSGSYRSYRSMLSRCYNENQDCYSKYGAVGVAVCERWRDSFENFYADMGDRPDGMTLDRKNPFGHYEPTNCRWSTHGEQAINRRGDMAIRLLTQLLAGEITLDEVRHLRHVPDAHRSAAPRRPAKRQDDALEAAGGARHESN